MVSRELGSDGFFRRSVKSRFLNRVLHSAVGELVGGAIPGLDFGVSLVPPVQLPSGSISTNLFNFSCPLYKKSMEIQRRISLLLFL